jgi:hypothetical protein
MSAPRRRSARLLAKEEYDLPIDLTDTAIKEIEKIKADELKFPIEDEDWVVFFCEYFEYIENNISVCLSKIPALHHVTMGALNKAGLEGGGFDSEFDNYANTNYNIGLYYSLFTQFRDGTNKIIGCDKINLLLSYVGKAVLRMAGRHNSISANDLIAFFRKIVVILELSVFQEVFLHYMTGDSTGHKHSIDFNYHNKTTHGWYIGIWLRKQEFLGVVTSNGKNFRKKYDTGLRLFVRNYLHRLIVYMRTFGDNYPLKHEKPYNYSGDIKKATKYPLPHNGLYKYNTPLHYYYMSRDDWDCIPNFLLPDDAKWTSFAKNFKHPSKWTNPPPQWWIDRIEDKKGLLDGYAWWKSGTDEEEYYQKKLVGTKNLAKWLAINGTLEEQYEDHANLWDADNEDFEEAGMNFGGMSGGISKTPSKRTKKIFKIIRDKDIALDPKINKELKYRLNLYFDFNNASCSNTNAKCDLIDNIYTNKLNSSIILYFNAKKIIQDTPKKKVVKAAKAVSLPKLLLSAKMRAANAAQAAHAATR